MAWSEKTQKEIDELQKMGEELVKTIKYSSPKINVMKTVGEDLGKRERLIKSHCGACGQRFLWPWSPRLFVVEVRCVPIDVIHSDCEPRWHQKYEIGRLDGGIVVRRRLEKLGGESFVE